MLRSDLTTVMLVSATVLGAMLIGQVSSAPAATTTAPGLHDTDSDVIDEHRDEFSESTSEPPGVTDADSDGDEQLETWDDRPESAAAPASLIGDEYDGYVAVQRQPEVRPELSRSAAAFPDTDIDEQQLMRDARPEYAAAAAGAGTGAGFSDKVGQLLQPDDDLVSDEDDVVNEQPWRHDGARRFEFDHGAHHRRRRQADAQDERHEFAAEIRGFGDEDSDYDDRLMTDDGDIEDSEVELVTRLVEQSVPQRTSQESQQNDGAHRRQKRQTARLCKWMGDRIGYRCDGPVERAVWRGLQRLRGVHDCSSMCRSQGRSGGSCRSGAVDRSTWCPQGQSCRCN